jgi:hypothetical protein
VVDSRQLPGPRQTPRPPIYVSALGPKSLALAAEVAEGWVSFGDPTDSGTSTTIDVVRGQVSRLNDELEAHGRPTTSMRRIMLNFAGDESPMSSFDSFIDWARRYRELGFDEVVVHWPVAESPYAYDEDLFERICREGGEVLSAW